ncbi:MAG: hypothetical protein JOZ24_05685 [Candidatus Eremiobacteraeota bacterium]|nr:hypothetical protein [Candidatus Eremiobacteraeota bacterium]
MGLPLRIAVPILILFAVVFLSITGALLRMGLGTTGSAFGPSGGVAEQGDARIAATPAPIATEGPGTFSVPQSGTGPVTNGDALPGHSTGGGSPNAPPAPVMAEVGSLRARLARNPNDRTALVRLADLEMAAAKFDRADELYARALALDPHDRTVGISRALALHGEGRDDQALVQLDRILAQRHDDSAALYDRGLVLESLGRRGDAAAAFRRYLAVAGSDAPQSAAARSALRELGG